MYTIGRFGVFFFSPGVTITLPFYLLWIGVFKLYLVLGGAWEGSGAGHIGGSIGTVVLLVDRK